MGKYRNKIVNLMASALLDCFVKRVEIGTEGNITVEYDLFGYETGFTMGSEAFKEVRKNPALLRH